MSEDNNISKEQARIKFIGYLSYLVSSALGLINEPKAYGPLRFLCAIEKLLDLLREIGLNDDEMNELLRHIEEQKEELMSDESKLKSFLLDVSLDLVGKLL